MASNIALALSVAFNELATNAVKYGAFSNEAGSIEVTWRVVPGLKGAQLTLHWKENGGPPVSAPTRKGFGLQVVERGLPQEIQGAAYLYFQPTGLIFALEFPIPKIAPHG